MSDRDLIYRGDVLAICMEAGDNCDDGGTARVFYRLADAIRALPAATPRPMAEAPQRFKVFACAMSNGFRWTICQFPSGEWVRWDDVAHLFANPEAPHEEP
jgi:hypothetical protein